MIHKCTAMVLANAAMNLNETPRSKTPLQFLKPNIHQHAILPSNTRRIHKTASHRNVQYTGGPIYRGQQLPH